MASVPCLYSAIKKQCPWSNNSLLLQRGIPEITSAVEDSFLTRLMGGWLLSRRLLRSAPEVVTPVLMEALERARAGLNFHGKVRLLSGEQVETPMVIGWVRPAILLPVSALTGLNPDQLLAVLAHELAHIRRHDFVHGGLIAIATAEGVRRLSAPRSRSRRQLPR